MSEARASNIERDIYVQILDEGTPVYRPVEADFVAHGIYRLKESRSYDSDECWEFPPGSLVKCEERTLQDGRYMVAFQLVVST
jgi:hypothetical protein